MFKRNIISSHKIGFNSFIINKMKFSAYLILLCIIFSFPLITFAKSPQVKIPFKDLLSLQKLIAKRNNTTQPHNKKKHPIDASIRKITGNVILSENVKINLDVSDIKVFNDYFIYELFKNNAAIIECKINNISAPVFEKNNRYYLILNKGYYAHLKIKYSIPKRINKFNYFASIEIPSAPIRNITIQTLKNYNIKNYSGLITTEENISGNIVKGGLPVKKNINITYQKKIVYSAADKILISDTEKIIKNKFRNLQTRTYSRHLINESFTQSVTFVYLKNISEKIESIEFIAQPNLIRIIDILGQNIDYEFISKNRVKVNFKNPDKNQFFQILYESTNDRLCKIKILNSQRQQGYHIILSSEYIHIEPIKTENLHNADINKIRQYFLAEDLQQTRFMFSYTGFPYDFKFRAIRLSLINPAQIYVSDANYILSVADNTRLGSINITAAAAGRSFMKIKFFENQKIWSASVNNNPIVISRDNKGNIMLPIKKKYAAGKIKINLVYKDKTENNIIRNINLPFIDAPVAKISLGLYLPINQAPLFFNSKFIFLNKILYANDYIYLMIFNIIKFIIKFISFCLFFIIKWSLLLLISLFLIIIIIYIFIGLINIILLLKKSSQFNLKFYIISAVILIILFFIFRGPHIENMFTNTVSSKTVGAGQASLSAACYYGGSVAADNKTEKPNKGKIEKKLELRSSVKELSEKEMPYKQDIIKKQKTILDNLKSNQPAIHKNFRKGAVSIPIEIPLKGTLFSFLRPAPYGSYNLKYLCINKKLLIFIYCLVFIAGVLWFIKFFRKLSIKKFILFTILIFCIFFLLRIWFFPVEGFFMISIIFSLIYDSCLKKIYYKLKTSNLREENFNE